MNSSARKWGSGNDKAVLVYSTFGILSTFPCDHIHRFVFMSKKNAGRLSMALPYRSSGVCRPPAGVGREA